MKWSLVILSFLLITLSASHPIHKPSSALENPQLYEGDIMLREKPKFKRLTAVRYSNELWPDAIIPYKFSPNIEPSRKELILQAMEIYHQMTCIRFVPYTEGTRHYVRIFKGNGCYSHVGFMGYKVQSLSLGEGCQRLGIVLHELGHTIGLFHEHTRSDRDKYLNINWENVNHEMNSSFTKTPARKHKLLSPFDYDSIMLYGPRAFSIGRNKPTIEAHSGVKLLDVWEKTDLSDTDVERIQRLYRC
ncbi:hypothetical protein LAZ67_6000257 [Cordylochernes scorpioides]|nr:hypothetical protein LAZ67_6000257 [Cordylochernes scorpioides]